MSSYSIILEQVQAIHSPDGREIHIKPLISHLEDMLKHTNLMSNATEDPSFAASCDSDSIPELGELAPNVFQIANKIRSKCSIGTDDHSITMETLSTLSNFDWDGKLLIVLEIVMMHYVEYLLIAQSSNPLAKYLAVLKHKPAGLELSVLKPQVEPIKKIFKFVLDIVKCIVELKELPVARDFSALATAMKWIPLFVYYAIREIVALSRFIPFRERTKKELADMESEWEESSGKLEKLHSYLQDTLNICYQHVSEKQYQNLLRVFEVAHTDNMEVLKALLDLKGDPQPLVDGATKKMVDINVLKERFVLLLMTNVDIPYMTVNALKYINSQKGSQEYDIVWLPILDTTLPWTSDTQKRFKKLQATIPWYTLNDPSLINQAVNKFVKEVWYFKKEPIVVVLDPQGQVASTNALHVICIWFDSAFPFTTLKEEVLWKEQSWRLELLVFRVNLEVLNWIRDGTYVCLYGGGDIEWIRKFTSTVRAVAHKAGIQLEMVYVGRSNTDERVKSNISTIEIEKLSHCLQRKMLWFWLRLENMWHSKNRLGQALENDRIMQEIRALLSYDCDGDGWAIISGKSMEMVRAKGNTFLSCLLEYNAWKADAEQNGFLTALRNHLAKLHTQHHWSRLVLQDAIEKMPETFLCTECGYPMGPFVTYQSWMSKLSQIRLFTNYLFNGQ